MKSAKEKTAFKLAKSVIEELRQKLPLWGDRFQYCSFYDTNQSKADTFSSFEFLLAADALALVNGNTFDELDRFSQLHKNTFLAGCLSYDLKDDIFKHKTEQREQAALFPKLLFFKPRYLIKYADGLVTINRRSLEAQWILDQILAISLPNENIVIESIPQPSIDKENYLNRINDIRNDIYEGEYYELNFCQQFKLESIDIKPFALFNRLNKTARNPFSTFFKAKNAYALCSSPERFLKKIGDRIVSQPIKGTNKKSASKTKNEQAKQQLVKSEKDRAENIMIVDLVRHDLSKYAKTGSIRVEALCEPIAFSSVNHLVSTISAELTHESDWINALRNAFPMGSMTGAPKLAVVNAIQKYEPENRNLYSGSIGYIDENGDFDFNVLIRTIMYDSDRKLLSWHAGGAITFDSIAELEYDECINKSKDILKVLGINQIALTNHK